MSEGFIAEILSQKVVKVEKPVFTFPTAKENFSENRFPEHFHYGSAGQVKRAYLSRSFPQKQPKKNHFQQNRSPYHVHTAGYKQRYESEYRRRRNTPGNFLGQREVHGKVSQSERINDLLRNREYEKLYQFCRENPSARTELANRRIWKTEKSARVQVPKNDLQKTHQRPKNNGPRNIVANPRRVYDLEKNHSSVYQRTISRTPEKVISDSRKIIELTKNQKAIYQKNFPRNQKQQAIKKTISRKLRSVNVVASRRRVYKFD